MNHKTTLFSVVFPPGVQKTAVTNLDARVLGNIRLFHSPNFFDPHPNNIPLPLQEAPPHI